MKTCQKNICSIPVIMRFTVIILIAMVGLSVAAGGIKSSREYSFVSKPRTKSRAVFSSGEPVFAPKTLNTAIGYGKRARDLQPLNQYKLESMVFTPAKDDSQRFSMDGLIQRLFKNPELINTAARNLLYDDETVRPMATHRSKKSDNEISYYFNE